MHGLQEPDARTSPKCHTAGRVGPLHQLSQRSVLLHRDDERVRQRRPFVQHAHGQRRRGNISFRHELQAQTRWSRLILRHARHPRDRVTREQLPARLVAPPVTTTPFDDVFEPFFGKIPLELVCGELEPRRLAAVHDRRGSTVPDANQAGRVRALETCDRLLALRSDHDELAGAFSTARHRIPFEILADAQLDCDHGVRHRLKRRELEPEIVRGGAPWPQHAQCNGQRWNVS